MLVRRCWFDLKPRFIWTVGFTLFFALNFFRIYFGLIKLSNSGSLSEYVTKLYLGLFSETVYNFLPEL